MPASLLTHESICLNKITAYLKTSYPLPPFYIPHSTVPACLTGLALWGAVKNDGINWDSSAHWHLYLATAVGFGAFGLSSLAAYIADRKNLINKIKNMAMEIDASMEGLDHSQKIKVNEKIDSLYDNSTPMSWSAYVNTAFAGFTATITSFAFTSLWKFIPEETDSSQPLRAIIGVATCIALGGGELLLAHYGQKQLCEMKSTLNKLNNINSTLISQQPRPSTSI